MTEDMNNVQIAKATLEDPEVRAQRVADQRALVTDEQRLATPSMKTPEGHYVDPDGNAVPGLPEPPEGHMWSVLDVQKMAAGQRPNYPGPDAVTVLQNPAHHVDLSKPYSNVDLSGVNHFARTIEGESRACGGCGQPWPCDGHTGLASVAQEQHGSLPQGSQLDAAARLLGISKDDLVAKLKA